jgi:hypothetical protein
MSARRACAQVDAETSAVLRHPEIASQVSGTFPVRKTTSACCLAPAIRCFRAANIFCRSGPARLAETKRTTHAEIKSYSQPKVLPDDVRNS